MYRQEWNQSDGPARDGGLFALTPWVRRLLIANLAVFLLTITVLTGEWVVESFGFLPRVAWQRPWTFVTYLFIHKGFLHLGVNMFMLFFFGPPVEERLGSAAFARYYFFCGIGGAMLSVALSFIWNSGPIVGASGALFGVALAFAMFWPNHPIILFPLPVPIKAKWFVAGYATLDLVLQIMPGSDGIAHLAHLGGFLFGILYLRGFPYIADRTAEASERKAAAVSVLVHPSAEAADSHPAPRGQIDSRTAQREDDDSIVDGILDKISRSGMDSLTTDERRILTDRSQKLRRH